MNPRTLEYVDAVARYKNFGRAARHCHVSQPTLSSQIRRLEEYLGHKIFERRPSGVGLTCNGREILERSRGVLEAYQSLRELRRSPLELGEGQLDLGVFPTIAPYMLPKLLPGLRRELPKLRLRLVEDKTLPLIGMLKNGDIGAALLALPPPDIGLEHREVLSEPFWLAVGRKHRLAKRKQVAIGDLEPGSMLLLDEGHCFRDQALEVCRMADIEENREFRGASLDTLKQMVATDAGVTLVPEMAIDGNPMLKYLKLRPRMHRRIGLVWYDGDDAERAFHLRLAELMRQTYSAKAKRR